MDIPRFNEKIDEMFGNLTRLDKRSKYEEKIFKPIIMVLGTA